MRATQIQMNKSIPISRFFGRGVGRGVGVVLVCGLSVGMIGGVVGCKGQQTRTEQVSNDEPVNSTLSQIGSDDGLSLPDSEALMDREGYGSVQDQIAESARQLDVYFANLEIDGGDEAVDQARRAEMQAVQVEPSAMPIEQVVQDSPDLNNADNPVYTSKPDDGTVHVSLLGSSGSQEQAESTQNQGAASAEVIDTQKQAQELDPSIRKEELAAELAMILKDLATTSDDPGSAALALASLETMLPSDVGTLVEDGVLSDSERASIDAVRSFLGALSQEGQIASPSEVSAQLEEIKRGLDVWAGLRIEKAALCTRVDGFGRYETFSSYRFVAGRSQPVIVYVELERFAQRELLGPDGQSRFETNLSQRLELYHVADDLNTWNRAAETVSDETRNRLRDYYLINQVTLPATLGVGRYHLKVVMRDLIGDRVAETIIPIEIVAR